MPDTSRPQLKPAKTLGWGDFCLFLLLAAGLLYLAWRLTTSFRYQWQWEALPQFILRRDPDSGALKAGLLLQGLGVTLKLGLWSSLLAAPWGLVLALGRLSPQPYLGWVSRTVVEVVRNLPPLVVIFIGFYFLSDQFDLWSGLAAAVRRLGPTKQEVFRLLLASPDQLNTFMSSVLILALYEGAYFAEIIRGGILSLDKGQWEAAYGLGLSGAQRLRHVILPQALRRVLPQLAGQFISAVKDSSIVSVISVFELTFSGAQVIQTTQMTVEVWTAVALMYLVLTLSLSLLARRLELAGPRA